MNSSPKLGWPAVETRWMVGCLSFSLPCDTSVNLAGAPSHQRLPSSLRVGSRHPRPDVWGNLSMRRAAALLAILLLLTLMPLGPPTASAYEPSGAPTFNVPNPWGTEAENNRIVAKVDEAFRHVRPTARDPHPIILVTNFLFDRKVSADALIDACRRGVSVRVIIDRDVSSRPFRSLVTVLNADNVRDKNRDG